MQNRQFFNVEMKIIFSIGLYAIIIAVGASCRVHSGSENTTIQSIGDEWRSINTMQIAKLIIAISPQESDVFTNAVVITDLDFVRPLFSCLTGIELHSGKKHYFVAPKLLVFSDENDNALCAFLYWPAGTPNHIFKPCKVKQVGLKYAVIWPSSRDPSLAVPEFDTWARPFFDVWDAKVGSKQ